MLFSLNISVLGPGALVVGLVLFACGSNEHTVMAYGE
jgi:hypothetical protein